MQQFFMDKSHKNLKPAKVNTHLVHYEVKIQCISRASLNNIEHIGFTTQLLCNKRTDRDKIHTQHVHGAHPNYLKGLLEVNK